jgi:heme oxygenase (biliverdin-IX-beta and delta-forming)
MVSRHETANASSERIRTRWASGVHAAGLRHTRAPRDARSILRAATDEVHERMHHHPGFAQLAAGRIERIAYRRLLARSYGFYTMAEELVDRGNNWACRLALDLAELGLTEQALGHLPRCPPPVIGTDQAARVGATYVLLGASLGGKVMARAVTCGACAGEKLPTRFLAGDDNASWKDLVANLDTLLPDECARSRAARSAVTMFCAFETWMNGWNASDD